MGLSLTLIPNLRLKFFHSGHGTFPNVINCMAAGMDMTPMVTKEISLSEVPENLKLLQTDRENCKISTKIN